MIQNKEFVINKSEIKDMGELPELLQAKFGGNILRWYISKVVGDRLHVEMTLLEGTRPQEEKSPGLSFYSGKNVVLSIIPTGVGCDYGGYAGDAAPVTALLASCTDYLITNPNAVNASDFIFMPDNILYTEGYMIDQFCKGLIQLYKPYSNQVGLIIEKAGEQELEIVFNMINTVRAVHGVNIEHYVITDELIGGQCVQTQSGAYVGNIKNPGVLLSACEHLIAKEVEAIAVTSNIKDLPSDNYARHFEGTHPNPMGGAEAVISHLICSTYKIPSAHAPMINIKNLQLKTNIVDARAAGEFSSTSGLACILIGLAKAPQVIFKYNQPIKDVVNINNLLAVVAPAGALGGIPVLYAHKKRIPIIAVKDNKTILKVNNAQLNLKHVIEVDTYAEAAGIIQALRKGINISSIYRPLDTLTF